MTRRVQHSINRSPDVQEACYEAEHAVGFRGGKDSPSLVLR